MENEAPLLVSLPVVFSPSRPLSSPPHPPPSLARVDGGQIIPGDIGPFCQFRVMLLFFYNPFNSFVLSHVMLFFMLFLPPSLPPDSLYNSLLRRRTWSSLVPADASTCSFTTSPADKIERR